MKKLIVGLTAGMLIGSAATAFAAEDVAKEVKALLGSFSFKVNGVEKKLETTPLVYEGTAYLPVREVAKLTGYELEYKEETRTIELKSNTPSSPPAAGASQEKPKAAGEEQAQSNKEAAPGDGAKAGSTADNKTDSKTDSKPKAMAGEGNWVKYNDLHAAFKRKKLSIGSGGGSNENNITVQYKGTHYKLEKQGDYKSGGRDNFFQDIIVDITPLIEAGIVTLDEVKQAASAAQENPEDAAKDQPKGNKEAASGNGAKAGEGNWVAHDDLWDAVRAKINPKSMGFTGGKLEEHIKVTLDNAEYILKRKGYFNENDRNNYTQHIIVDITPLIEAGIITLDDVKKK